MFSLAHRFLHLHSNEDLTKFVSIFLSFFRADIFRILRQCLSEQFSCLHMILTHIYRLFIEQNFKVTQCLFFSHSFGFVICFFYIYVDNCFSWFCYWMVVIMTNLLITVLSTKLLKGCVYNCTSNCCVVT